VILKPPSESAGQLKLRRESWSDRQRSQGALAEHPEVGDGIWLTTPRGISGNALVASRDAQSLSTIIGGKSNSFVWDECRSGDLRRPFGMSLRRSAYATACGSKVRI